MQPIELGAIVTAAATVVLAIYAGIQLWLLRNEIRESRASRDARLVLYVVQHFNQYRHKWNELYNFPQEVEKWEEGQKELADELCVEFQQVAFLAETGLVDSKYLMENYAGVFAKAWPRFEGFVRRLRQEAGEPATIKEGAFQRRHLETFSMKCRSYMEKRFTRVDRFKLKD